MNSFLAESLQVELNERELAKLMKSNFPAAANLRCTLRDPCRRNAPPMPIHQMLAVALTVFSLLQSSKALAQGKPGEDIGPSVAPRSAAPDRVDPYVAFADRWDVNHDGVYACDEWKIFMVKAFTLADKNRDNIIVAKEFAVITSIDKAFSGASLSYFDLNGDNVVSRAELVDRPNPLFVLYDSNKDCQISRAELKSAASGTGKAQSKGK